MSHSAAQPLDARDETWQAVESFVDQLAELSRRDLSLTHFHRELVHGACAALSAAAVAVWLKNADGKLDLIQQVDPRAVLDFADAEQAGAHRQLLGRALAASQPLVLAAQSGRRDPAPVENPSDLPVVLCPIVVQDEAVGVLEVLLDAEAAPSGNRATGPLVEVLCELAADFHRNWRLRQMQDRQLLWDDYDQLLCRIHASLDLDETTFAIANEARRLIGCDRVTVVLRHGRNSRRCRVAAISGLDKVDRRSQPVRQLEMLADQALLAGEPVWRASGEVVEEDLLDSEPGERRVDPCLEATAAQLLGVLPLSVASDSRSQSLPLGALIVETFQAPLDADKTRQRSQAVSRHAALALGNALMVSRLPLLPLLRRLGQVTCRFHPRQLPATMLLLAAIASLVAVLLLVPADFTVSSRGQLVPVVEQTVFAPADGTIRRLNFLENAASDSPRGIQVAKGEILAQLQNPDVDYELTTVLGEKETVERQLETITASRHRLAGRRQSPEDAARFDELTAQQAELVVRRESLQQRLRLLRSQQADLAVRAEIDGRIQTWDAVRRLAARPVRRGQKLLSIVDPNGPWTLQLQVPDHHMGYVLQAQRRLRRDLPVSFLLKSDPQVTYQGQIQEVAPATEVDANEGASVVVRVAIDREQLPGVRPGMTALAKIQCGSQPLGYVWLHDLIEFMRSRILF